MLELYSVPAGQHRSEGRRFICPKYTFVVELDVSCQQSPNKSWNKIAGFSDGLFHHRNSCRVVVRWLPDSKQFEFAGYVYNRGKWTAKHLLYINPTDSKVIVIFQLSCDIDYYYISFTPVSGKTQSDDGEVKMRRSIRRSLIKYQLFPYFGGQDPAIRDWNVKIKWI